MYGVKHHLLGRLGLEEDPWSVSQFTTEALSVIESIKSRGKLPILVGGTHYYTQSLLLRDQTLEDNQRQQLSRSEQEAKWPILKGTEQEILDKLREVDPEMASRWHPRDARRIRRSLEIWLQTGRRASQLYAEQQEGSDTALNPPNRKDAVPPPASALRFDSLTFCTYVEKGELDRRISERVDGMLDDGLLEEVQHMHQRYKELGKESTPPDPTRGIWVAIGYKEFASYLAAQNSQSAQKEDADALRAGAIEKTRTATRQYARRQMRWIRQKLLPTLLREGGETSAILLDCNSVLEWAQKVEAPAVELSDRFLHGRLQDISAEMKAVRAGFLAESNSGPRRRLPQVVTCPDCGAISTNTAELERHAQTTRHKRAIRKHRRSGRETEATEDHHSIDEE